MTNKLSDRLREEISVWPKTASLVTTLREAMEVVKAWEDAPEGHVDMKFASDAIVIDYLPEYFVNRINKRRVKLVVVDDEV